MEDGKAVFFGPETPVRGSFESVPCEVVSTSGPYFAVSLAWALQKHSPFTGTTSCVLFFEFCNCLTSLDIINNELGKFLERGLIHRHIQLQTYHKNPASCFSSGFNPIKFYNIFTTFIVLMSGTILALMVMCLEHCFYRCESRSHHQQHPHPRRR